MGLLEWELSVGDGKLYGSRREYGEADSPEPLTNGGYWFSHFLSRSGFASSCVGSYP